MSSPACARSRICWDTSVGISATRPVPAPRAVVARNPRWAVSSNLSAAALRAAAVVSFSGSIRSILLTSPLPRMKYCPASSGTVCSAAVPNALPTSISAGCPASCCAWACREILAPANCGSKYAPTAATLPAGPPNDPKPAAAMDPNSCAPCPVRTSGTCPSPSPIAASIPSRSATSPNSEKLFGPAP